MWLSERYNLHELTPGSRCSGHAFGFKFHSFVCLHRCRKDAVDISTDHVDGRDVVLVYRCNVLGDVSPREDAAVHTGVQRLHAACAGKRLNAAELVWRRLRDTHDVHRGGLQVCGWFSRHLTQPPPSSISGKPVSCSTRCTGTPSFSMVDALPPVDTMSKPSSTSPCQASGNTGTVIRV